jgi:hypothetical protein
VKKLGKKAALFRLAVSVSSLAMLVQALGAGRKWG